MSYCLNPICPQPVNPEGTNFCLNCGSKLLLKERYAAIKPIGQGGFGRTFLGVDEDKPSKPRCAIKQFYPQAQGTKTVEKAIELFNQEAVRLDELGKHPQIPELLAYLTQDNRQYLVQEFIDGQNLAQELAGRSAFNETEIRQVLNDLLPVLQFVHSQNVIHRDIKPENIIRRGSDRQLILVDFGAAKFVAGTAMYQPGTSIGSPEYVAPEQVRGQAVFSSDIYSLGVTCIHLLTQMSPFDLYDVNEDAWVWRHYLTSGISDALGNILDKMLEIIPSRRYQSATEVLQSLHPQSMPHRQPASPPAPLTPATPAKPAAQSPPATPVVLKPPTPSRSKIDEELAEVSSQFLTPPPSKNPHQASALQTPPSPNTAKSKSPVDLELEEVKSQYVGSATPKKPNQT